MQIVIVGAGYVGLVSGACFAEFGISVVCVDSDADRVRQLRDGELPIYEPGLDDLVARNVAAGRLTFQNHLDDAIPRADAVFIAVGTPSRRGEQAADLEFVHQAVRAIAERLDSGRKRAVIIAKSTVPVGTAKAIERLARISHHGWVHGAKTYGTGKKDNILLSITEPPHAHRLYLDATGV